MLLGAQGMTHGSLLGAIALFALMIFRWRPSKLCRPQMPASSNPLTARGPWAHLRTPSTIRETACSVLLMVTMISCCAIQLRSIRRYSAVYAGAVSLCEM